MQSLEDRQRAECCRATNQEGLVELKQAGELFEQLVDTVQPLQEDGTLLAHIISILLVATAVSKLMTVVQPVDLYKHLETLWSTCFSVLKAIMLQCKTKAMSNELIWSCTPSTDFVRTFFFLAKSWPQELPRMQLNRNFDQSWVIWVRG